MIDKWLARRVLNKVQKDLLKAQEAGTDEAMSYVMKAYSELDLMYDILHLDEVDIIETKN